MEHGRILIADANSALTTMYGRILSRHGFQVETAGDGLQCVAKLRSFDPDLLVLDPGLPWGQGVGVLAMMYEEADVPKVPVVLLARGEELQERAGLGPFPVSKSLVRPVAPTHLAEVAEQMLGRQHQRRPVGARHAG